MAGKDVSALSSVAQGAGTGAAVGGPWGAVIGGGIGLAGSLMGGDAGAGEAHNEMVIAQNILNNLANSPDISKPLILEQYRQQGILTPQMEQYITAQEPKAITTDPALKSAQMQALQQLQQRSTQGLSAGDRAALNQARLAAQGDVTGRLASIQQQAAMRGQAGGGTQLAAELAAAQGGANTASQSADQVAQQAQQAALQATGQQAGLAGQVQQQDFGQQFQQQQAQQQMQRFNVGNQIAQQQRNVGAANQAQAGNLALSQQVSNANVGQANQELQRQQNAAMQQAQFNRQNQIAQAGGYTGQIQPTLQMGQDRADAQQNQWTGASQIGQGLYGAFSAAPAAGKWQGGEIQDFKQGGQVPGQANVPGDSPKNDTVHAMLSPGELVVPRSLAESKLGKELTKLIHAHNSVKNKLNEKD